MSTYSDIVEKKKPTIEEMVFRRSQAERPFPGYTLGMNLKHLGVVSHPVSDSEDKALMSRFAPCFRGHGAELPPPPAEQMSLAGQKVRWTLTPSAKLTPYIPKTTATFIPHSDPALFRTHNSKKIFEPVANHVSETGQDVVSRYFVPDTMDGRNEIEFEWGLNEGTRRRFITARMKRIPIGERRSTVIVRIGELVDAIQRVHFFCDWPDVEIIDNKHVHFRVPLQPGAEYHPTRPRLTWSVPDETPNTRIDSVKGRWVSCRTVAQSAMEL